MPNPIPPDHESSWTPKVRQLRSKAIMDVEQANFLVRRVSAEEREPYEKQAHLQSLTPQHLDALFPKSVEPIKVFSLDTRFRFQDSQRNYDQNAYCSTMLIPITPKLIDYFRRYFYPDNIKGGVPGEYRGNPAFKKEKEEITVVIRKAGWSDFWELIDDIEYTPGFMRYGNCTGF
ncbi:hypothetical protein [Nitratireductor sp. GCM10026969]|uniref:hypothetical protein n=1 Tax=Nitratireductor sp. GCM10026969 TaxID=3252645 RepID=UPI0036202E25